MPTVRLSQHPELLDQIERYAIRYLHDGQKVLLTDRDWRDIQAGREPAPPKSPPMGDARPDLIRDQSCCDPPLTA